MAKSGPPTLACEPSLAASPIPAVDRALRVLQVLAAHESLDLGSISTSTGLPLPSAHRVVRSLVFRRFAEQDSYSRRYRLGSEVLRLAFSYHERLDVRTLVHPVLEEVSYRIGETAHLGVLVGSEVTYLDKVEPEVPIKLASTIGSRNPATCTALGKAILAWTFADAAQVEDAFDQGKIVLVAKTHRSIRTYAELQDALHLVRQCGYAVDDEENELGVRCVAVALLIGGRPSAAVSISGPASRLPDASTLGQAMRDSIAKHLGPEYCAAPVRVEPGH